MFKRLTDDVWVAGQLGAEDFARAAALESRLRVLSKCQDPTASLMEWTSQYDKLLGDLKEKKEQLFDQIQTKLGEELNDG